ncbi:MAG: ROK family protein [Candidatus Dormibacteraeota bacterium]|nr:ROK family protein [Candidatus Dormibacteraeota bacterium]
MIALVDVGGTKLAAATASAGDSSIGAVTRLATESADPAAQLLGLIDDVCGGAAPDAVAMSVPGPFDRDGVALENPPGLPQTWWGLRIGELVARRYGCPVVIENDANCAALAESRWGAGRGARTVVYFTVSTGIGTGVVCDGAILTGRKDTEGGHQVLWPEWAGGIPCHCGGFGCLEALASGRAIERRFGRPAHELDEQAAWDDVGRWLGLGVVNATALIDPDCVLFGGGVTGSWDRFAPCLMATVEAHVRLQRLPRVERGSLGEARTLLGALALLDAAR